MAADQGSATSGRGPTSAVPVSHPYRAEVDAEREGWYEFAGLIRRLTPEECLRPGYYRDPEWSVRDVAAHVGTWLAEAGAQFERISAGTYEGHDLDIDALNAEFLTAMSGQPWTVAWLQATAGRTRMIEEWYALRTPSDEAAWWIRKSGSDHYAEHVDRLRVWVDELVAARTNGEGTNGR